MAAPSASSSGWNNLFQNFSVDDTGNTFTGYPYNGLDGAGIRTSIDADKPRFSPMAALSASSSGWLYDVFLNFRGEDTRNTFTGHLYNGLDGAAIRTYIDSENLHIGEDIGAELLSAIQHSRVLIPIFSKNYASSKWCLNELVKIVECRRTMNQLVLPIFYDVDPSDVRNCTGSYADALQEHGKHFHQRIIDEWKEALGKVGELKGWDLRNIANGHEGTLVKLVVAEVLSKLRKDSQIVSDDLVGIQSHVEKMMSLLNMKSEDVKIVGIRGLGGIGKTTIAKVVYNTILHHFEGCSFLSDVRETSQRHRGLIDLQNQLVSDVLKESLKITKVDEGINVIKERLRKKKVFIILDDVDEKFQLDGLVKKRDWFGKGSRIVITTRNVQILVNHEVDEIYEPSEMNANQSLQLFSRYAFKMDRSPEDFLDLSKDIVKITGGLPLALEVIGSSLFGMRKSIWHDTLKMLQEIPHDKVQRILRISFDGLTYLEKAIFLDIACFFIGMDKNIACFIWQECNFYPEIGIEVLCQKSLVKIGENNELKMHDQLRDLGKEIVRQENLKSPGERSRLWSHKEALDVLEKHTGLDKVEGLSIDFGGSSTSQCCLMSEGFAKMTHLRLLEVERLCIDFMPSFSKLIWLRWKGCASEFTRTKFHPVNLVVLDMSYSLVTINWIGWSYIKVAKNLKVLNLTGCQNLLKIPELGHHCLEILIVESCYNLVEIDESICSLTSLKSLNLHQCRRLNKLPDSLGHLENLETFDASSCVISDSGIPSTIGWPSSLKILRLGRNYFCSLPVTVSSLSSLQTLDLQFCNNLESLPELPSSLKCFSALGCKSLKSLPRLSNLTNLEVLCLDYCENLLEIPALLGLRNMERLNLDNCQSSKKIGMLEGLDSLELFTMKNCKSVRKIGKMSSLRKLKELRFTNYSMLCEIEGLEGLDSLELLTITRCTSLIKMPGLSNLKTLRVLEVEGCEELREIEGLAGLDSLELLTIKGCESLRKMPELVDLRNLRVLEVEGCGIEGLVGLDSLELLTIKGGGSMKRLPDLSNLRNLKHLSIVECNRLKEIQGLDRLISLKTLHIRGCISMKRLPDLSKLEGLKYLDVSNCIELKGLDKLESLEALEIWSCKFMERLPDLSNLKSLKYLHVSDCIKLKEIQGLDRLESIDDLEIWGCEYIEKLPDLSNLKCLNYLHVSDCIKLKEIQGLDNLESLGFLFLSCQSLERLPDLSNLRNLKQLSIVECVKLKEIQGLDRLESFETLEIWGCEYMETLPDLSNLKNLNHLDVSDCIKLKEIQGLDRLESLESLGIRMCKSMERLPDLSCLRNLKRLSTIDCNKLKEIQGLDRLESLESLDIRRCESMDRLPDLRGLRNLKSVYPPLTATDSRRFKASTVWNP